MIAKARLMYLYDLCFTFTFLIFKKFYSLIFLSESQCHNLENDFVTQTTGGIPLKKKKKIQLVQTSLHVHINTKAKQSGVNKGPLLQEKLIHHIPSSSYVGQQCFNTCSIKRATDRELNSEHFQASGKTLRNAKTPAHGHNVQ